MAKRLDSDCAPAAASATAAIQLALYGCSNPATLPMDRAEAAPARAEFGTWGIDLRARDESIDPGDDFFRYANGAWLDSTSIPTDRNRWGMFDLLRERAAEQVRELIQSLPETAPEGTLEQKVGDYYRAYMDIDAIEAAGLGPAQPALQAIEHATSHNDIARLMGQPGWTSLATIRVGIGIDQKNPNRYVVVIGQGGLSMPDREYYLSDKPRFVEIRNKFHAHLKRMLELAGEPDASTRARAIFDLETRTAHQHWPQEQRRQRDLTYHLLSRAQLEALAPEYPWTEALTAAGLQDQTEFVVGELSAVQALGEEFPRVPIETWKSYLKYHYLTTYADVLPTAFDEEHFDFYEHTLQGQPRQRERWKRAVETTGYALGEAIGQLYVQKYFSPQMKPQMLELVEQLRQAYANRIERLDWMTPQTKAAALEKLHALRAKIAYPDQWRDYTTLSVSRHDVFGNDVRCILFNYRRRLDRIHEPPDRDEWGKTPQTVNAHYSAIFNEIVFPAAMLQAPFFDLQADMAVNYGAIGAIIGHEMSHGFDDQGAKSDAVGVLRNWWQPEDEARFKQLGNALAAQFDQYEPLPGLRIRGRFTLGENIGDLGGVTVAYEAYRLSLQGHEPPVIDGLTGDQRFFLSWAQCWRAILREERLRYQIMTDTHSPPRYRVNGILRNIDAWYTAFNVQPGNGLYLSPQERVQIW